MVLSSQIRYDRRTGVLDKQSSKPSSSGAPFRSGNVRALLSLSSSSSSPDRRTLVNQPRDVTFERDESPTVIKQQYIAGKLGSLPPHVIENLYQVCIQNEAPSTILNPRAAKILQIEPEVISQRADVQQKSLKRRAVTTASAERSDDGWSNHGNMQITLHIANEDEVVHFLKMRFTQIQQLATKVIAKAWIKAICPKKQANFPYVDSNPRADQTQKRRRPRNDEKPRVPMFWPDVELCRHKEPDHTRKTERTHLLVHLLRLHWTEQDWFASNGQGSEVPQKIKDRNWIGFLKDAFPISKLNEVQGSNPDKAYMRRKYLDQIYRVAEDEQMLRRRVGPTNPKRTYTAGAGWVPAGPQAAGSASQSDPQDSEDESDSPPSGPSAVEGSNSHSENQATSPDCEEQLDDIGSASSCSGVEIIREAKVEHVPFSGFLPMEEVVMSDSSHGPELKFDPADEAMTNPLASVPRSRVESLDYYGSPWNCNTANVQRAPDVYQQHQYAGGGVPWYDNASHGHQQQSQLSNVAAGDAAWSSYRHGYGALPDKAATQTVAQNVCFGGMQQMAMARPFMQPVVTAASDGQQAGFPGSEVHYVGNPFEQHSHSGYLGTQHQGMYSGWP